MTNSERNSFWNLLLLCRPHHRHVDDDVKSCTVDVLKDWKRQAEVDIDQAELEVVRGLTEDQLEQIFKDAMKQHSIEIKSALDELKQLGHQNVGMLRNVLDKLDDSQIAGGYIDADRVSMLNSAAEKLSRSFHDETVGRFYDGAHTVARTFDQDRVTTFSQATRRLEKFGNLVDQVNKLERIARDPTLVNLPDTVTRLSQIVKRLPRDY